MKKMSKRLYAVMLCLICALALFPARAFAAGAIDLSQNVDFTISYRHDGNAVSGVPFELYRAADVDAYGEFTLSGDFAGYPVLVNGLSSAEWKTLAETLKAYVDRDKLKAFDEGRTDNSGILKFPNTQSEMKPGLYLVIGRIYTSGGYTYTTEPFLVMLPSQDEEKNIWSYSVGTAPKHTRGNHSSSSDDDDNDPATVVRKVLKVWKDENGSEERPQSVTVQLLKNGDVYDTVTLNADNNWRYTWKDLLKYERGNLIDWSVAEKEADGYTVTVSREGITFVVTNTGKSGNDIPDNTTPDKPTEPTKPEVPETKPDVPETKPDIPETKSDGTGTGQKGSSKLPQTGVLWWPVPVLAVGGLTFLIAGAVSKKKKDDE